MAVELIVRVCAILDELIFQLVFVDLRQPGALRLQAEHKTLVFYTLTLLLDLRHHRDRLLHPLIL